MVPNRATYQFSCSYKANNISCLIDMSTVDLFWYTVYYFLWYTLLVTQISRQIDLRIDPFEANVLFPHPLKNIKKLDFLKFSWGVETDHLPQLGSSI